MRTILRINSRTKKITTEKASDELRRICGRQFIAHILNQEVEPTCEPLGRFNKFIISQGWFSDTNLSTAGKISMGGKSPLTGGIKESNTGGFFGKRLSKLGIKGIIIEDIPANPIPTRILYISGKDITFIDAPELQYLLVSETIQKLRSMFQKNIGILCIGPAGERLMSAAGIACPDDKDIQVRYAGRGGLGALLGSKGIKAIVVNADVTVPPEVADSTLLKETIQDVARLLTEDPKSKNRKLYGTLDILAVANQTGLMPTRNFSSGTFENVDKITGPGFSALVAERGGIGRSGTPCVPGCTVQCSNVFADEKGENKIVASLQYESVVMLGPNLGIGDVDTIGELNNLCNEVGVDSIECGAALGVALEAGVAEFGDGNSAMDMIRQIGEGTYLGRILGNGAKFTGQAFGIRRVPAIKGQAMPAYDPRGLKGNGVLYATSTMGADHTAGNAFETLRTTNPLAKENQVFNSRQLQIRAALLDTMGVCIFIRPAFVKDPILLVRLFKAKFGWDITYPEIRKLGAQILEMEREFNYRAGASEHHHRIPEFMRDEPLPPNNSVFDISQEELEGIWDIPIKDDFF
jgi:aldehyde:ferredoxin oxidoreductase